MAKQKEKLSLDRAMDELEANGTAQNVKVYGNHGVKGPAFGVSYAFLKQLHRRVGTDHELALGLWATGNHDARVFACWVADAGKTTIEQLEAWSKDVDNHVLAYEVVSLAQDTDRAGKLWRQWVARKAEWPSTLGWGIVGRLATQVDRDPGVGGLTDEDLAELVERIAATIHAAPNRTRHTMNQALVSIGCRPGWRARAKAAAKRIGKLEVDYGKTSCKVTDAAAAIDKSWAHYEKKGKTPVDGAAGQRRRHC